MPFDIAGEREHLLERVVCGAIPSGGAADCPFGQACTIKCTIGIDV